MNILLVAGGSGGHIVPAFAVASALKKKDPTITLSFVCSRTDLDIKIYEQEGIVPIRLFSGKLRRYFSWKNFTDPFFLLIGFFQIFFHLLFHRPNLIFSKGGFVAVPVVFAAFLLRIPIFAHESDAVMGLSNRLSSRFVSRLFTAFPHKRGECVGLPVRASVLSGDAKRGRDFLHFSDPKKPILFGFFGSQGAATITRLFLKNVNEWTDTFSVVWVFGRTPIPKNIPASLRAFSFLHEEFPHVLAASDFVVARSGSSVFEIAAAKKAAVFLPLKSAAGNHQFYNAQKMADKNAALILEEKNLTALGFFRAVRGLLHHPLQKTVFEKNIASFFIPHSAEKIAREILDFEKKYRAKKGFSQKKL